MAFNTEILHYFILHHKIFIFLFHLMIIAIHFNECKITGAINTSNKILAISHLVMMCIFLKLKINK